jgi:hypothetical protein
VQPAQQGNPLLIVELQEARGASICPRAPLEIPSDAPLEDRAEASAERVASELQSRLYAVVDDFLPPGVHRSLALGVRRLHRSGGLRPGEVEGGQLSKVRGDLMAWVDPFGDEDEEAGAAEAGAGLQSEEAGAAGAAGAGAEGEAGLRRAMGAEGVEAGLYKFNPGDP